MIVMVENEEVTGTLNARTSSSMHDSPLSPRGVVNPKFTENKLYAEYLRREGRETSSSMGSPRAATTNENRVPSRGNSVNIMAGTGAAPGAQPFHNF